MIETNVPIHLEIIAADKGLMRDLENIARTCVIDLKLKVPVDIFKGRALPEIQETLITLHVPVELALTHDDIWNLVFRLTCFCPQARISTQIEQTQDSA